MDASILGSLGILGVAGKSKISRTLDDGCVVAGELILVEEVTDLHLYELEELFVVNLVSLVHEYNDVGYAYLTGKQDVLSGLGHRTVSSGNNEDSAVHLRSTGDHVLNVVGVAGAVNVSIVTVSGLVLNVSGVDCDTTLSLLWSLIDVRVIYEISVALEVENLCDCSGECGLAVVNVADSTNVNVRLISFELFSCHWKFPP